MHRVTIDGHNVVGDIGCKEQLGAVGTEEPYAPGLVVVRDEQEFDVSTLLPDDPNGHWHRVHLKFGFEMSVRAVLRVMFVRHAPCGACR
jgi:hypothetical protein